MEDTRELRRQQDAAFQASVKYKLKKSTRCLCVTLGLNEFSYNALKFVSKNNLFR